MGERVADRRDKLVGLILGLLGEAGLILGVFVSNGYHSRVVVVLAAILGVLLAAAVAYCARELLRRPESPPVPIAGDPPPAERPGEASVEGLTWRWTWFPWPPAGPAIDAIRELAAFCPTCGRRLPFESRGRETHYRCDGCGFESRLPGSRPVVEGRVRRELERRHPPARVGDPAPPAPRVG